MIAGFTVGLTVIPQGLAYAQVAGLSPEYGLYSAFMGCFIYMIFGTSKDITLGPTAIMSLMTASFAASPIHDDPENPTLAIVLCLLSGCVQLLMGMLSLGFLVDFIPYPCINAFTCAAAITIGFGQVKSLLGLENISREFMHQVYDTFKHIPDTKIYDFIIGLVSLILLYILKRVKNIKWSNNDVSCGLQVVRKTLWILGTARNALIVVSASVMAGVLDMYGHADNITLTGNVTAGLPPFRFPNFTLDFVQPDGNHTILSPLQVMGEIGPGIIIVPLMGIVESIAIGNSFARANNYKIQPNQELIAIGASNILSSFVGAYPVTGSFSRTAVNSQSGVKTPAGGLWTGALVILSLAFLTEYFKFVPDAALAAVIMMAVWDMVNFQLLRKLWRIKRIDIMPWMVTFILSFVFGVEWGIIAGVFFSLLLLLYPWSRPEIKAFTEGDTFKSHLIPRSVMVVELAQGLRFPGIEYVREKIMEAAFSADTPRSLVFDVTHMANIDYSTVQGLTQMKEDIEHHNILLVFAGFQESVLQAMLAANLKNFKYTEDVESAIRLVLDETGCEEDPRQSLLASGSRPSLREQCADDKKLAESAAEV